MLSITIYTSLQTSLAWTLPESLPNKVVLCGNQFIENVACNLKWEKHVPLLSASEAKWGGLFNMEAF